MADEQPNERLLPCPWCHRDDCLELGERLGWQIIYCDYCGACGPYPVGKLTPEEAWNTRVPAVHEGMVERYPHELRVSFVGDKPVKAVIEGVEFVPARSKP